MIAGVITLLLPLATPAAPSPDRARFAIVIGQNAPEDPLLLPLRFADDDALATHRLLIEAGVKSVLLARLDEDSRRLHPSADADAPPRLESLFTAFEQLTAEISAESAKGRETELFLFYSGHGDVEHGEGYLVLEDGRLTRSDLFEKILARSPATLNHVIIDACRSYFLIFEKGPGGERAPAIPYFWTGGRRFPNTGFVLSTSSDRESHEWERFQAGIFSHEVRSALRGAADVDDDGRITYGELGAFIQKANERIPNAKFRPDSIVIPPGAPPGDFSEPILRWPEGPARLSVNAVSRLGHFYLEDPEGLRLVDAHPRDGEALVLRLPRERPLFLRKADESAEYAITDESADLAGRTPRPSSAGEKGASHLAFQRLFAEPFGRSEVVAFERERVSALEAASAHPSGSVAVTPLDEARHVAPWVAGASALIGGSLTLWALERRSAGETTAQRDRAGVNDTIARLNTAAAVAYATATAAALTWAVLSIWPEKPSH